MRLIAAFAAACFALVAASPAAAQLKPAAERAPVEGTDYIRIADGKPWSATPAGKGAARIEVAEVFAYWCPHCAHFEPVLERWAKTLPKDVRLVRIAAAFQPTDQYARAFFAAESMKVLPRTHQATFDAIHRDGALPARGASADEITTFYASRGVDAKKFAAAIASPAVDARLTAARDFAVHSGVEGTPTVIVDGVYRVQARTMDDMLRITDALVARQRAALAAPAAR